MNTDNKSFYDTLREYDGALNNLNELDASGLEYTLNNLEEILKRNLSGKSRLTADEEEILFRQLIEFSENNLAYTMANDSTNYGFVVLFNSFLLLEKYMTQNLDPDYVGTLHKVIAKDLPDYLQQLDQKTVNEIYDYMEANIDRAIENMNDYTFFLIHNLTNFPINLDKPQQTAKLVDLGIKYKNYLEDEELKGHTENLLAHLIGSIAKILIEVNGSFEILDKILGDNKFDLFVIPIYIAALMDARDYEKAVDFIIKAYTRDNIESQIKEDFDKKAAYEYVVLTSKLNYTIYQYEYTVLCLEKVDLFKRVFPTYLSFATNPFEIYNLILLLENITSKEETDKFLKEVEKSLDDDKDKVLFYIATSDTNSLKEVIASTEPSSYLNSLINLLALEDDELIEVLKKSLLDFIKDLIDEGFGDEADGIIMGFDHLKEIGPDERVRNFYADLVDYLNEQLS